jgi:hypothetical protein
MTIRVVAVLYRKIKNDIKNDIKKKEDNKEKTEISKKKKQK